MNYYEKRAVKHNIRIDMYFKINAEDGLYQRSNQITFNPNEPKLNIYKRFIHEYKHLMKAGAEFLLVLGDYGSNGVKLDNIVKINNFDGIQQQHINYNKLFKYRHLFQNIQQ